MNSIARSALIVALLGALSACGREPVRLPEGLCGRWVTDDAKYAGRYLELSNETIRFGSGQEELDAFPVVEIRRCGQGGDVRYDMTYLDSNGDESVFTFDHQVTRRSIRISHSPQRQWKKWTEPLPEPESPLPDEPKAPAAPPAKVEKKPANPQR